MDNLLENKEELIIPEPIIKEEKKKSAFKQKYDTDPEFKKKHLLYLSEKVECEICNKKFFRSNKVKHINSLYHKKRCVVENEISDKLEKELYDTLKKGLNLINKKIELIELLDVKEKYKDEYDELINKRSQYESFNKPNIK